MARCASGTERVNPNQGKGVMIDQIFVLENEIQHYAWGSPTAIPELLGISPSGAPHAELWMGAHPKAPSIIVMDGERIPLHLAIARDPEGILGRRVAGDFGGTLPFLFKVLAAAAPLSIQAHPDRLQAEAGFQAENRRQISLKDPKRNYRDPNHKPECICALTPFWGLCGFREVAETLFFLERLCPRTLAPEADALRSAPPAIAIRRFYQDLLTGSAEKQRAALTEGLANAAARTAEDPVFRWVARLHEARPNDISVLSPAFLNLFRLAPGEALFLPAGELHAYLDGVGIELMANSDNVLRGGLTRKHMDVPELLRILSTEPRPLAPLVPKAVGGYEAVYPTGAREFRLSVISVPEEAEGGVPMAAGSVEILLCVDGGFDIAAEPTGQRTALPRGGSVLVPAGVEGYTLRGRGKIFRASVPE